MGVVCIALAMLCMLVANLGGVLLPEGWSAVGASMYLVAIFAFTVIVVTGRG